MGSDDRPEPRARAATALLYAYALAAPLVFLVSQLAWMLAVAVGAAGAATGRWRGRRWPLGLPIAAFFAWSALAAGLAADRTDALDELQDGLKVGLFYLAVHVLAVEARAERFVTLLLGAGALAGAIGIVQACVAPPGARASGLFGSFPSGEYMTFASVMAMLAVMGLGRAVLGATPRLRWFGGLAGGVALGGVLASESRAAWIAVAVGATLVGLVWRPRYVGLVPVVAAAVLVVAPAPMRARLAGALRGDDPSTAARVCLVETGVAMVRQRPWFGLGPGAVARDAPLCGPQEDPRFRPGGYAHLHSTPLQIAAERGLPALAAWVAIWLAFFLGAARSLRRAPPGSRARAEIAGGGAAIAAFLVLNLFDTTFYDSETVTLAWAIAALPLAVRPSDAGGAP